MFNLSHASITSPDALMALRNLPKTNPALHKELSQDIEELAVPPTVNVPEEPAFADNLDDSSDVPIAVVKSHIISASQTIPAGFGTHDDGSLCRSTAVEDTDFDPSQELEDESRDPMPVVALELGHGHRTKRRRRLFGDEPNWD